MEAQSQLQKHRRKSFWAQVTLGLALVKAALKIPESHFSGYRHVGCPQQRISGTVQKRFLRPNSRKESDNFKEDSQNFHLKQCRFKRFRAVKNMEYMHLRSQVESGEQLVGMAYQTVSFLVANVWPYIQRRCECRYVRENMKENTAL